IAIGDKVLGDFHGRIEAIGPLMREWDSEIVRVRAQAARMAWLLDGWSHITGAWEVAQTEDQHQQAATVNDLVRILPLLPRKESSRDFVQDSKQVKL
ncbi:hypothetical protein ABTB19_20710, partial [Acinetobacter baumannii]